jgi:proteasome lid subunit RPN8/RPN11
MTLLDPDLIVIPASIVDEVVDHADRMYDGYESAGALIYREADGYVIRYDELPNHSKLSGSVVFGDDLVSLPIGCRIVLTHSHPYGPPYPSVGDIRYQAFIAPRRVFCIVGEGELGFLEPAAGYSELLAGAEPTDPAHAMSWNLRAFIVVDEDGDAC